MNSIINLDDENEVAEFIEKYKTTKGRRLANLLGLRGKGCVKVANNISCYAWNKFTAIGLRELGKIEKAQMYEGICDRIYKGLPSEVKW